LTVLDEPEAIYDVKCDIFSPCALGGVLNKDTIPRLCCAIVAGAANNQLLAEGDGERLQQRNILYAPDYIINAGGVINISFEIGQPYKEEAAMERVARIYDTVAQVIETSKKEEIPTAQAADLLAERRIAGMGKKAIYLGR
ncbi:MAG: leucine dehydrogenase, partial [Chloroflexi bacterium]|nr:leucine dehydrogenase [Chloroflexota bacterium]